MQPLRKVDVRFLGAELAPLALTRSTSLVRWTVLTGFATGLVWAVPAAAILVNLGLTAALAIPVLGLGAVAASVIQAHRWVGARVPVDLEPLTWPAEWTMAVGSIGPNLLIAAAVTRLVLSSWVFGAGSVGAFAASGLAAVAAGLLGLAALTAAPVWLAQLPTVPALRAIGQESDDASWSRLLQVATTWIGLQAGLATSLTVWLLLAL